MINRVLIVNDSHIERVIAKEALSDNFMVFEAESGDEAYRILDKERVDIIFLDNVMKGETGYDIAKKLRKDKNFDNIPLVLMTSNDNPINEIEAFESGFNKYLHKSDMKNIQSIITSFEKKELDRPVSVLVVDDSRIIRNMLSYTFSKEGFTVLRAESGEEAIEMLKQHKPDFITMDVEMGGIDGYQTSKLIRSNPETQDIPIIMITNIDTVESRIKGFEAGIAEYFTKPFEPIKLVDYVKNVILRLNKTMEQRILVVEDTLSTQHIISYTLRKHGFNVECLANSSEIWNTFNREKFDLILVDFDLGISRSYELIQRIKERNQERNQYIPIIVITSITNKYAIIESFRKGADDYISRPVSEQELLVRVLTHLSHKKQIESTEDYTYNIINNEFIAALSHDMRSPLTAITSTAELLLRKPEKYGLNESGAKFIKNIHNTGKGSMHMVDELIHYMNIKLNNVDLSQGICSIQDIAMEAKQDIEPLAKKKSTNIMVNIKSDIDKVKLNKKQTILAFSHLIENAVFFSENDKTVVMEIDKDKEKVTIDFIDEGTGIKENIRDKIFKPFFTYCPKGIMEENDLKLAGLGLPIAKEIIERQNGELRLLSSDDNGSVFRVILNIG
jgi:DNA-binding response OmpR family regulator